MKRIKPAIKVTALAAAIVGERRLHTKMFRASGRRLP